MSDVGEIDHFLEVHQFAGVFCEGRPERGECKDARYYHCKVNSDGQGFWKPAGFTGKSIVGKGQGGYPCP